ncbi:MAG: SpoVG family protein [Firmicutes bacterium]|nr:SpoVG family protein [[Eubacterium] siraeum]MCM1488167.1 SpoVG family protein [Bacillota bacterium]
MKIDVRINSLTPDNGNVKAIASAHFDECFAIKGIKVMEGRNGLFVSMPSQKGNDGQYHDICFPTTAAFRSELNNAVEQAYRQAITQLQEQSRANFTQAERIEESAPMMSM